MLLVTSVLCDDTVCVMSVLRYIQVLRNMQTLLRSHVNSVILYLWWKYVETKAQFQIILLPSPCN